MTFDSSEYRGYISSTPTLVDIDGNGFLDTIVATGGGFIYAIDHTGKLHENHFPFVMDAVFGEIIAEDVTGDGEIELIATDSNSNVVCFDIKGKEVWETRISGVSNAVRAAGDPHLEDSVLHMCALACSFARSLARSLVQGSCNW